MVLVLHEELKYKVESLSTRRSRSCSRGSKTNPVSEETIPDQSTQSFTVVIDYTVQHLLVKNDKGKGRLINFLSLKRKGGLLEDSWYASTCFIIPPRVML